MISTVKENFFTSEDIFGNPQGFAFGVALWEPLDPRIGELAIYSDEWGAKDDGEEYWKVMKLETHTCTEEELGLSGDNRQSIFMPSGRAYQSDF